VTRLDLPVSPRRRAPASPWRHHRRSRLRAGLAWVALASSACGGVPRSAQLGFPDHPPEALPERALEFPPFEESTLPNGLRLIVVRHRVQPVAEINLYVKPGASAVAPSQVGLAGLTADLLTKGTATRSANEISETIERVGGSLSGTAGLDWLTLSASVLAEHLPLALELVAQSAQQPTFPQSEFELSMRRTLSSLQAALGQSGQVAQRAFDREVYGEAHPYGVSATPATVQALTRDDVVRYHQTHYNPANALLVVAGDVDPAAVRTLVERQFGGWSAGTISTVTFPQPRPSEPTRIALVHRPGSAQTNILIGHLGIRPDDPDYFPMLVLSGLLGGNSDARLFRILREERGWTYGAYSSFNRPLGGGSFSASAEVRPEVTDSAVAEILVQLRRLRDERVPNEELEAAKGFLAGSFPLRIETAAQVGSQLAGVRLFGVPIDYVTQYRQRIQAVTPDDVQRAARTHLQPDQAVVVVVGDAVQLRQRLASIAPLTFFDVEGRPLDPDQIASSPPASGN
jgi:zinc protease